MKLAYFALSAAVLLAGCNQTPPATSEPATTADTAPVTPIAVDSANAATTTAPDAAATAPAPAAAPALKDAETMKVSFSFKPTANPDNPKHPRVLAHLLVQGSQPLDIDLGKFPNLPDMVTGDKAKAANFPEGMLMGFRSYDAAAGISQDLAVLHPDARHLRVVQRRVDETNPEAAKFETSREVPLPANTLVVAAPVPKPPKLKD
ncbi:hypothetical protein MON38_18830 [Hymenobacter sp. DH14]|uniref:Stress-response A/B barrel domain-containing protein n=1 Tax=Hymenobacter cyanobacteriorum TaxID=2926463 RepID=A0A9X1VJY3_9BACT|nr:hypothetical protein [Hymenobacter cyanobacteriorum]MCI1189482.1 hypothetical protein [Hymenobacter cyanobacteriorum]